MNKYIIQTENLTKEIDPKATLTKYCIAIILLNGPGGPIKNTSWPKTSFWAIHCKCRIVDWDNSLGTKVLLRIIIVKRLKK